MVPRTISNISHIEKIAVSYNQLTGNIPGELGQLLDLSYLALGGNNLSGGIPHSLLNMSSLQVLAMESNMVGGTLPPNIGDALPDLQMLVLGRNLISKCFQSNVSRFVV